MATADPVRGDDTRARLRAWWAQQRARDIGIRAVPLGPDHVYPDTLAGWLQAQAWRRGWRDGGVRRWISRALPDGGVAVDVGAYLGWYTLAFARQVGPGGRVLAFEPEASNFDLLTRAVGGGRLPQVEARQIAVLEQRGWTALYVATTDRGDHRVVPAAEERRVVTVPGAGLDELLADAPRVDVVKIAAQGTELSVLRGLRRTLARPQPPRVLCTLAPALLERAGTSPGVLFELLDELGYVPYRCAADGTPVPVHPDVLWREAVAAGRVMALIQRRAA